ncbi:lanthionine synthetase C family protein [Bacillus sp. T_4]|nr:lanthionine synthetase C family protein [Bacillus sp. T_4]
MNETNGSIKNKSYDVKIEGLIDKLINKFTDLDFLLKNDPVLNQNKELTVSFAQGFSGLCILYAELDYIYPHSGWDQKGHEAIKRTIEEFEHKGTNLLSTFNGLSGLCFAVTSLSKNGERYKKLLDSLHNILLNELEEYIESIKSNLLNQKGINNFSYDVCYGISGIGRYLILLENNPKASRFLKDILEICVDITDDITIKEEKVPGWFTPQTYNSQFETGFFDTGLAHGICGPMNLLSIALKNGYTVDGQLEAIKKISYWLMDKSQLDDGKLFIPNIIPFNNETNSYNKRDAWCYGGPGISRSLFLSGKILGDEKISRFSKDLFNDVMKRNFKEQVNISATFCHGLSGLLHITNIMCQDTPEKELIDYQIKVLEKILNEYDEKLPFGFQDINIINGNILHENKMGLLEGALGILLSLLAYKYKGSASGWDKMFLLN